MWKKEKKNRNEQRLIGEKQKKQKILTECRQWWIKINSVEMVFLWKVQQQRTANKQKESKKKMPNIFAV